jgi:hypothetical protein
VIRACNNLRETVSKAPLEIGGPVKKQFGKKKLEQCYMNVIIGQIRWDSGANKDAGCVKKRKKLQKQG